MPPWHTHLLPFGWDCFKCGSIVTYFMDLCCYIMCTPCIVPDVFSVEISSILPRVVICGNVMLPLTRDMKKIGRNWSKLCYCYAQFCLEVVSISSHRTMVLTHNIWEDFLVVFIMDPLMVVPTTLTIIAGLTPRSSQCHSEFKVTKM